jgi:hypothetical protein
MTYISEILWYSTWPATLVVSYYLVVWAVKKYDYPSTSDSED